MHATVQLLDGIELLHLTKIPSLHVGCSLRKLWCLQEAEGQVVQEESTVPGEFPGIYACDYKKLAQIMVATAEARLALMQGDASGAEVRVAQSVISTPNLS